MKPSSQFQGLPSGEDGPLFLNSSVRTPLKRLPPTGRASSQELPVNLASATALAQFDSKPVNQVRKGPGGVQLPRLTRKKTLLPVPKADWSFRMSRWLTTIRSSQPSGALPLGLKT